MIKYFASVLALAVASQAQAANLIVNGDFEAGNTGFSSDYTYSPGSNFAAAYTVGSDPRSWNNLFSTMGDHTTGTGLMMIINGSGDVGDVVWSSGAIGVDAGTNYFFEAFVASVHPASPPSLSYTVSLDGGAETTLATLPSTLPTGVWQGFSTNFNTGGATSVELFLRNAQSASFGNDFALDDVTLATTSVVNPGTPGAVPEPATWALMIAGFGAVGGVMRFRPKRSLARAGQR